MIRIIAKLFAVAIVLTAFLPVQPSSAGTIAYVSATGSGTACSQDAPCATIDGAIAALPATGGRVVCLTGAEDFGGHVFNTNGTFVFDCPSASWLGGLFLSGASGVYKFQHIGFTGFSGTNTFLQVVGGGTVIYEDCVFEDLAGTTFDIEPNAPFNLVVTNSRISNNTAGVLLKPAAGGSVTATFNRVTITNNSGGGLKTDSTNGAVTVDITDSVVSNNGGNGMNAVGGAGGPAMFNIHNSVIAKNGVAGVQVNGATAAAMVDTTLFDTNVSGATTAVNGGHMLTYGNNRIVGSPGFGFTGSAPLQ